MSKHGKKGFFSKGQRDSSRGVHRPPHQGFIERMLTSEKTWNSNRKSYNDGHRSQRNDKRR